jgi:indolepyruvate ferredoxin oxidoreductase beta subunit
MSTSFERPLTIAMLALGGQGGGVLTNWLVDIAEANGFLVQSTYVAGVAQRSGATVYCVEMFPRDQAERMGKVPVFALYPVPGDVDLVIASELAESSRAIQKGMVTPNLTTLLSSSHRVHTMDERMSMGDGIADSQIFLDTANEAAKRFVCFDMQAAADASNSIISAVILGGIAGTEVLPFSIACFEDAIRRAGRAVDSNLAGFRAGLELARHPAAQGPTSLESETGSAHTETRGPVGEYLSGRVSKELPAGCQELALAGALRALDYQDRDYAVEYLDTLVEYYELDREHGGADQDYALTSAIAPQLALQMCYEDTIRVADLKTRLDRMEGIRSDVAAATDQPTYVVEYFHPRFEEVCDTLPAGLGRRMLNSGAMRRLTGPLFRRGINISTTKITGFVAMLILSKGKRWRRRSLRFEVQSRLLDEWKSHIRNAIATDYDFALALAESIRIVKGYGDTYERGLTRYKATLSAVTEHDTGNRGELVNRLIVAAMQDEKGEAFERTLLEVEGSQ